jgi:hypothetical protein
MKRKTTAGVNKYINPKKDHGALAIISDQMANFAKVTLKICVCQKNVVILSPN